MKGKICKDEKSTKRCIRKIEEKLIKIGIDIAREKEGALFVLTTGRTPDYKYLVKQSVKPFNILSNKDDKLLESLATIDGAVIISNDGMLTAYGVMIKTTRTFKGFGTRHAAAISASQGKNICILISEEQQKIKLFRNGRYIMQIDALEKGIENKVERITTLFESLGAGFIGTIGAAVLAPALGIALIPGVIIFGGGYYAIKKIMQRAKLHKK